MPKFSFSFNFQFMAKLDFERQPAFQIAASNGFVENVRIAGSDQGCQIFLGSTYQNGKNIPNGHKIYLKAVTYTK
jgi:hypothetical protein